MDNKWWLIGGGIGLVSVGAGIGALLAKRHYDNAFDAVANDIYNECYREARQEIEQEKKRYQDRLKVYNPDEYKPKLKDLVDFGNEVTDDPDRAALFDLVDNPEDEEPSDLDNEIEGKAARNELPKQDKPHAISYEDFTETNLHYSKLDIFYYSQDSIFADDEDQILGTEDEIFGEILLTVEPRIRSGEKVYLRFDQLESDFEVHALEQSYHEIAFETAKERERRITKRKMRNKNM